MLRQIKSIIFSTVLISLTGCFEIKQEIWVNPDGSGRLESEWTLFQSEKSDMDEFPKEMEQELKELKQKIKYLKKIELNQKLEKDGRLITKVVMDVTDITKLGEIYKEIKAIHGKGKKDEEERTEMNFIQSKNKNIKFTYIFDEKKTFKKLENAIGNDLMNILFLNKSVTVILHGNLITANETINPEPTQYNKNVKWEIPMLKLMKGEKIELTAEIKKKAPINLVFIICSISTIFVLIIILVFIKTRKKPSIKQTSQNAIIASIVFECPSCKQSLEVGIEMEGQTVTCPTCNSNINIPT